MQYGIILYFFCSPIDLILKFLKLPRNFGYSLGIQYEESSLASSDISHPEFCLQILVVCRSHAGFFMNSKVFEIGFNSTHFKTLRYFALASGTVIHFHIYKSGQD
jgi:hypothetical protein